MKSIKKNIIYNLVYQVLAIILPFITAPYLSRVIGASGVGVYSFSHSMALYFTYFTLLGLTNYGNRAIAAVQDNYEERSKLFCEIYVMQVICFTVSIIVYVVYIICFSTDQAAASIMLLTVVSAVFDINWFFFGMEKFKLTVIRNTIIKIATVVCIFLFVNNRSDIYIYVTIMSIGFLACQLCLWPFMRKMVKLQIPKWSAVKKHFRPNLVLFVPVIAISIYKIMDKVFLGYMSTMEQVGYYENAERIITIAVTMITAVGTVMLPRMSSLIADNKMDESKQYIDKTMLIVLAYTNAVLFGIVAVAKDFSVVYYGEDFIATGVIMCYLAVTVIFLGCGSVIRTQYLIPNKEDSIYLISAIIGAVINVIINTLLIPKYAAVGAAIGTICAEVTVCIFQMFSVRKELNLGKYLKWEIMFAIIGSIMFLVIKLVPVPSSPILALCVHILSGTVVYVMLAGLYFMKGEKIAIFQKRKNKRI